MGTRAANGAAERLAGFGDTLRDASSRLSHGANVGADYARAGADYARTLGADAYAESLRAARSTRKLIEQRPLEAVLIVGLASFAIGWVLRRLQEPAAKTRASAARASRPTRRRTH
ncbi:MAG TPA: hypothetical protein VFV97_08405 [Rhodanobacteraceae bacterium]|nr:hypothetical protein [Rhodanobacteraceae bacterium]